ncbi:cob(I)yrinic acid a,c-diamide adenosyltransferase [candidate division GN15 bacterium]|nr:cob(I)yrinic acid a,c-diamide adenosyltransferase [candidate division GN15 bacterium]
MAEETKREEQNRALLLVYTGNGKGKTTAALGMCIRAIGYKWPICIVQFVKGSWKYGELKGIKLLKDYVEMHVIGEGFVGIVDDTKDFEEHREAARKGVELTLERIRSREHRLVIVDELNVAMDLGLVTREEAESIIDACDDRQHLVITGRGAPDWLIERADLVTEMTEIKHPYQKGILAQKGVDW